MNKRKLLKFAVGAVCAGIGFSAAAGPLQTSDVPKEPAWVIHLDVDAMKQSAIGKFVLSEMDKPENEKKLASLKAMFRFDVRQELHGLTLYGTSPEQEDGVLLIYGDIDAKHLTTLAEGAKEHTSTRVRSHTIHSWIDEKRPAKDGEKPRTYAAIHAGRVLIFGQKEERVADALSILDRINPSLAANSQFTSLSVPGAFLIAGARKMQLPASDPNAALLKQGKLFRLSVGESQGRADVLLSIEADNEEVAKQMESIGRGLVGLMALQQERPEAVKLAQAIAIETAGAMLTAKISLPAEELVGMIRARAGK